MTDDDGVVPVRTGLRIGWLVLALLVIALAVSGWFILSERMNQPVAGRPTVSPMLGGAGSIDRPAVPPAPPPTPSVGRPDREVRVSGAGDNRTIVCADNAISINGVNNTVTISGHCTRVEVSGVENRVTVEAADAISVSGIRNQVRFRSGTPDLEESGIDNTVERG